MPQSKPTIITPEYTTAAELQMVLDSYGDKPWIEVTPQARKRVADTCAHFAELLRKLTIVSDPYTLEGSIIEAREALEAHYGPGWEEREG